MRGFHCLASAAILVFALGTTTGQPVSTDCKSKRSSNGYDVVLLMGQSNMVGLGVGYDSGIDGIQDPRIKQWSRGNTIVAAKENLDHALSSPGRVGMGTSFARSYLATLPGNRGVLLVPTAYGGTSLVNGPWSPGGNLFEDAMTRINAALASGSGNCVAAVLWHQGENDVGKGTATYKAAFDTMVSTMRTRVPRTAKAPLVVGEFTQAWQYGYRVSTDVRTALMDTPNRLSYTAWAPSNGLAVNQGDPIHFSAAGMRAYGVRYFEALTRALDNAEPPATPKDPTVTPKKPLQSCEEMPEGQLFKITSKVNGLAVNVNGASRTPGASIIQWPVSQASNENWTLRRAEVDGYYYVNNQNSGMGLNVYGNSMDNGARIVQWTQGQNYINSQWCFKHAEGGFYTIESRSSGLVIAVPSSSMTWGTQLIQYAAGVGWDDQQWQIEAAN